MPELRIYTQSDGYFRLYLTKENAIRAIVELRKLNMGLTFHGESHMISYNISAFDDVETLLDTKELCVKRFKPIKASYTSIIPEKEIKEHKVSNNTITLNEYLIKIAGFM